MGNLTLIAGWWLRGWLSETKARKWGYDEFLLLFKAAALFSEGRLLNEVTKRWMNPRNKARVLEEITPPAAIKLSANGILTMFRVNDFHSQSLHDRHWVKTYSNIPSRALFVSGNDKSSLKFSALCWMDHYDVLYDLLYSKVTSERWL